jgi:16S rRNA (cytosine967-C5)-methyltransferase
MLPTLPPPSSPAGKRWHHYLKIAQRLVTTYRGEEPLSAFLKKYFAANKKHGGSDRKNIAALCYAYFRLGFSGDSCAEEIRWQAAIFLGGLTTAAEHLLPASWQQQLSKPVQEKITSLQQWLPAFDVSKIFPLSHHLSAGLDAAAFSASHLIQPDLFLRIRPGCHYAVEQKLSAAAIPWKQLTVDAIALPNHSPVDQWLTFDQEVVVQDLSSQHIGTFFEKIAWTKAGPKRVWDCCAASGGKSLLAIDSLDNIQLTVSDIRESVLVNLRKRMSQAGWKNYTTQVVDLTTTLPSLPAQDLIICDVPCSGSGTWGRTPENIRFFSADQIKAYTRKQQSILSHTFPLLDPGGYMLYITCSVFKEENEAMVDWLIQQTGFALIEQELIIGYEQRADSMFAALLQRSQS